MAMLLGPANGSIMVRHVLDVREGALPSNHTIPTLSLFPRIKRKEMARGARPKSFQDTPAPPYVKGIFFIRIMEGGGARSWLKKS